MRPEVWSRVQADWEANVKAVIEGRDTLWYPDGWAVKGLQPLRQEPVRAAMVLEAVCGVTGFTKQALMAEHREKRVVLARKLATMVIRERCSKSYPQLGRIMCRDQATCRSNYLSALKLVALDPDFREMRNRVVGVLA